MGRSARGRAGVLGGGRVSAGLVGSSPCSSFSSRVRRTIPGSAASASRIKRASCNSFGGITSVPLFRIGKGALSVSEDFAPLLCGVVFVGEAALRAGLDLQGISLRAVQAPLGVASASHAAIDSWSPPDLYPLDNKRAHEQISPSIFRRDAPRNPAQQ